MLGEFSTLGCAAATFQKAPSEIKAALKALGLRPAFTLNLLAYFRDQDLTDANRFINLGTPDVPRVEVSADE